MKNQDKYEYNPHLILYTYTVEAIHETCFARKNKIKLQAVS